MSRIARIHDGAALVTIDRVTREDGTFGLKISRSSDTARASSITIQVDTLDELIGALQCVKRRLARAAGVAA